MLSPAESTNSITVGASFGDSFAALDRVGHFNYSPYLTEGLPNISSGLGLGVRRSVKPDMVFEGGKERVALRTGGGTVSLVPLASGNVHFGHRVASPDNTGLLNSSSTSSGTSNAAALVTHNIARVIDALDPQGDEDSLRVPTEYLAVSAKALAIHSCKWSPAAERILEVVGPEDKSKWARRRLNVSSGIGCGTPDFDKVVECARHRAVMLHWGRLSEEQTIVFRIPVPNELSGVAEARRVSITVAWLSPINPGRAQHRMARLEIAPVDESKFWLGTSDTNLPTGDSLENGTVSQVCLVGDNVVALAHEGGMAFRVNCRAQYDSLKVSIPYAVCVSLELGAGSPIDVYSQVRNALRQRVAARVPVGA